MFKTMKGEKTTQVWITGDIQSTCRSALLFVETKRTINDRENKKNRTDSDWSVHYRVVSFSFNGLINYILCIPDFKKNW